MSGKHSVPEKFPAADELSGIMLYRQAGYPGGEAIGRDYPEDKMRYIVYRLVSVDYWWGRLNLLNRLELGGEGVAKWVERQYGRMAWEISGEFLGVALEQGCDLGAEIK